MRKIGMGVLALTILATPLAAQQGIGSFERVSAPVSDANELNGNDLFFVAGLAVVALAVVLLAEGDDEPISA